MLPDKKSKMRRNVEISWVVRKTIVDQSISKPVKSYQEEVFPSDWIMLNERQNTESMNSDVLWSNISKPLDNLQCEVFSPFSVSRWSFSIINFSASSSLLRLPRLFWLSLELIRVWFAWSEENVYPAVSSGRIIITNWWTKFAGISFLFHLAIFWTTTSASSILPVDRSQRGDSGTNHLMDIKRGISCQL